MQVNISPEMEQIINARVESGMYPSAGEVVRDALQLLADHDEVYLRRLQTLRKNIEIGWQQSERGEVFTAEEVEAELDQIIAEAEKNA